MTIKKHTQFIKDTNLAVKEYPPLQKMLFENITPSLERLIESSKNVFSTQVRLLYAISMVMCCLGIGTIFQTNQAYQQVISISGNYAPWLLNYRGVIGVVFAVILGLVIIGGVQGILRTALKSLPLLTLMYFVTGCNVLVINNEQIMTALFHVIIDAFDTPTLAASILGVLFIGCRHIVFFGRQNTRLFKTKKLFPLELVIDSLVIFTLMALLLLATIYQHDLIRMGSSLSGVATSLSPTEATPGWFDYVGVLLTLAFVFTSLIASSYYGLKNWHILWGDSLHSTLLFKLLFCVAVILGCVLPPSTMPFLLTAVIAVVVIPQILGWVLVMNKSGRMGRAAVSAIG